MSVLATDDFNRANGSTLGANWTNLSAGWDIFANEAESTIASGAYVYNNTVTPPNDQYAKCTLRTMIGNADEGPGPAVRMATSGQTFYFGQGNSVDTRLYKVVAGSFTQLGSTAAACATGDVLQIEASGSSIPLKKNGTTIIGPVSDSAIASGRFGLWGASASTMSIDNWEGGDFSGGGLTAAQEAGIFSAMNSGGVIGRVDS